MKTIITVQHTQSMHHLNGMVGSWTDWDLSPLGHEQARRIGAKLAQELANKPVVIYSSDLKRAHQTAAAICAALGAPVHLRRELRERNLGKCCGQSVAWLREHLECEEKTIDHRLFSDAESRRDEWMRLKPFFEEIMTSSDEWIIIVSHGDLLSVFNAMFLNLAPESLNTCELFGVACGISHMIVTDEGKRFIKRLSDLSYIQP